MNDGRVVRPTRIGDEDFVARIRHCHDAGIERSDGAGCDDDPLCGNTPLPRRAHPLRYALAQGRKPRIGAVFGEAGSRGGERSIHDRRRRGKIRLAHFQVNNVRPAGGKRHDFADGGPRHSRSASRAGLCRNVGGHAAFSHPDFSLRDFSLRVSAILISALASPEWFGLLTCHATTGDWAASLLVPTAWFR
jgi:hypothetical protein